MEVGKSEGSKGEKVSAKQKIGLILSVLLVISLIAFVYQNSEKIKIDFFMLEFRIRIIYIILLSIALGIIGTYTFQKYISAKKRKKK